MAQLIYVLILIFDLWSTTGQTLELLDLKILVITYINNLNFWILIYELGGKKGNTEANRQCVLSPAAATNPFFKWILLKLVGPV